jgi:hypothetical protein
MHGAVGLVGQLLQYPLASAPATSGTLTVAAGATIVYATAHSSAGGSVTLPSGTVIAIPAGTWWVYSPLHSLWSVGNNALTAGSQNFVFTGTDSYFVEAVLGNMSV